MLAFTPETINVAIATQQDPLKRGERLGKIGRRHFLFERLSKEAGIIFVGLKARDDVFELAAHFIGVLNRPQRLRFQRRLTSVPEERQPIRTIEKRGSAASCTLAVDADGFRLAAGKALL